MSGQWRFLAQNLLTRGWVSTDLPVVEPEIERVVSGPGGIRGFLPAEWMDGPGPLREWQTAIYAEQDGVIRHGAILVYSSQSDDAQMWSLEAAGWTTYPHDLPFNNLIRGWQADPWDVVRRIWDHIQEYPNGDIGMTVAEGACPVKVGNAEPPKRPEVPERPTTKAPLKGPKPRNPDAVAAWEASYKSRRAAYEAERAAWEKAADKARDARDKWDELYGSWAPYELAWWEAPDCGTEIDRLAAEVPFDYRERHRWNKSRTDVEHYLDLGYPRLGAMRDSIAFVIGENVQVIPKTERDGGEYRNEIVGLGKGEGRAMKRSVARLSRPDGRLRRAGVLPLKDVGSTDRLKALSEAELAVSSVLDDIEEIRVDEHPNAPLGSFEPGDIVPMIDQSGGRSRRMRVRVLGYTVRPFDDDHAIVSVVNADKE